MAKFKWKGEITYNAYVCTILKAQSSNSHSLTSYLVMIVVAHPLVKELF